MSEEYDIYNRPMRLSILQNAKGCHPLQRLQLYPIKLLGGKFPGPHCVLSYHRELFGKWWSRFLHRALRQSKFWHKAELELFAAFTSNQLSCGY